jgi:lactoylglutathione lyase
VADPLFRTLDCLALRVDSLDDAVAFYGRLGHELIWRTPTAVGLRLADSEAELVLQTERPGPETDLVVDAIGPAVDRFTSAGGRVVVPPFDIAIGRCAVVADPWGNHPVLLDRSKGSLVTDSQGNVTGVGPSPAAR